MPVGMYAYTWDLMAEGVVGVVGTPQGRGVSRIATNATYHSVQAILPHNPKYKVLQLKAACYFQPEERSTPTRGCAPRPSPLMEGDNWIARIVDAAHQRDIAPSSWTVCCHNSELGFEHPELAMRNVFGDPYTSRSAEPAGGAQLYPRLSAGPRCVRFLVAPPRAAPLNQFPHHQHLKLATALDPLEFALLSMCFCDACGVRASEATSISRL